MKKPTYLVYDIETIPDVGFFRDIKYPDLTEEDALAQHEAEKGTSFLPPQYHIPISIAVLKLDNDYLPLNEIQIISDYQYSDEGVLKFWQAVSTWGPTLVDFNGRGFDLPVLTSWAFSLGIPIPAYFAPTSQKADYRYRYGSKHIDLQDWISGYAGRLAGGLKLFSCLAGGKAKSVMHGSEVHNAWQEGRYDEIDAYCRDDVKETYRVFLRTRLLMGKITREMEKDLLAALEAL